MKLSIVIICWNDWKVIENCLYSIFDGSIKTEFEVIVSDNGSTDGSIERIRAQFPAVRLIENGANLGFAKANNVGIREANAEYILILNPDTIVHAGSLDRWIEFADRRPEVGAFGCKVFRSDGTYWPAARPFPTVGRVMIAALGLRALGRLGRLFVSDEYEGWNGNDDREIDWQSGCCILFRGDLLHRLGGFDEQFFYHYEEVDLCHRVWESGHSIRFAPMVTITHLGGQSVDRFPVRFALEKNRNCYRYFYKHFGAKGARRCRKVLLTHFRIRQAAYGLKCWLRPTDGLRRRLDMYRVVTKWNALLDPIKFVEHGIEPGITQAEGVAASPSNATF
jgi:GT2 family glycosyltransferase